MRLKDTLGEISCIYLVGLLQYFAALMQIVAGDNDCQEGEDLCDNDHVEAALE